MNQKAKSIIFTSLVVLCCNFLFSQDLIIMRNGDEVKAKVFEILQDQIKYKKWDNQDGPLYTESKSSIFMIKYQNGTKEVFDQQQPTTPNKQNSQNSNGSANSWQLSQSEVENCIKQFVNNNSFSGGQGWGEKGDFNVMAIKSIERIAQFSETEASTVVNFTYQDAFSSNPLNLKFTFNRDIRNNWYLTSVKKIKSDGGSERMGNLLYKWKDLNIPVKKGFTDTNSQTNRIEENNSKIVQPIVNTPIDFTKFTGKLVTGTNNYNLKIEAIEISDEIGNNSEIASALLNELADLKLVSQTFNEPADTISLITIIRLRYITNSVRGSDFYFTDCNFEYFLVDKKKNLICHNLYEKSNYSTQSNGFNSKLSSARSIIGTQLKQTLHQFFVGNFPITAQITEITEKNKKETEAKFVRINAGKDKGIFKNFEFILQNLNSNSSKGDIQVTEVFENYSVCKVLNFEKEILEMMTSGNPILVKTKYKATY